MWALLAGFAGRYARPLGVALLAAFLSGLGYALYAQVKHNGALTLQLDQAAIAAADNERALVAVIEQKQRDLTIVTDQRDETVDRLKNLAKAYKEVSDAPASDDEPTAPVLRRALGLAEQLRQPPAALPGRAP